MLALAFLTITTAAEHACGQAPDGQIPLTRNEIARLIAALAIQPSQGPWHRLRFRTVGSDAQQRRQSQGDPERFQAARGAPFTAADGHGSGAVTW